MGTEKLDGLRPRRRMSRPSQLPSAAYYVGYVEEGETPQMIMKKFEELEKVKSQVSADTSRHQTSHTMDAPLSCTDDPVGECVQPDCTTLPEAQLLQVFKQTSVFNVRSALQGNRVLMAHDENPSYHGSDGDSSWEDDLWGDLQGFWSDEDAQICTSQSRIVKKQRKCPSGSRRNAGLSIAPFAEIAYEAVTHNNGRIQALIARRDRGQGNGYQCTDTELCHPQRTCSTIMPIALPRPHHQASKQTDESELHVCSTDPTYSQKAASIVNLDCASLHNRTFLGVLINRGWEMEEESGGSVTSRLAKVPVRHLCPVGFVFLWADKQHMVAAFDLMDKWGYAYVDNLTWVYLAENNAILTMDSPYALASHLTLYIFRRQGFGRGIELRHQRNPDVIFDRLMREKSLEHSNPEQVYETIETLLPTGKGALLEMFAPPHAHREGWVHVVQ